MTYPTMSIDSWREMEHQWRAGGDPKWSPEWEGAGPRLSMKKIEECAAITRDMIRHVDPSVNNRDDIEGRAAVHLYEALADIDFEILDNPGFWRYLSVRYFREFIQWRQDPKDGSFDRYVSAETYSRASQAVLTRMYRRVASLGGLQHRNLSYAGKKDADFWQSHILRRRTGSAPAITRAFTRSHAEHHFETTKELRPLANALSHMWVNIVPEMYESDEDAERLVEEIRKQTLENAESESETGR